MRTHEVAYLLNPAFCGRILYSTIKTYNEILNKHLNKDASWLLTEFITKSMYQFIDQIRIKVSECQK